MMKKIFCVAMAAIALSACHTEPKFCVEGHVTGAEGKMLYFEASSLEGVVPLDSVKLGSSGSFRFKQPQPESPELYRLRVEEKVINLSVDSTETLTVQAPYVDFATKYSVEGSENCSQIKELVLRQVKLQADVDALAADMRANKLTPSLFQEQLNGLVNSFKEEVKVNTIFAHPNTTAAYYALFQQLNGYRLFDPLNSKDDVKCFAAVATSLYNRYPHATRSKNLYNIVIKGMKNTRKPQQKVIEIPEEKINTTGVIDIALRDIKGEVKKLSELKGKVVLLDFTIYQTAVSASHNYLLRDLYDKYAAKGLEIYQISLDADEHFWKTTALNLPWNCVRDSQGIYSNVALAYNVQAVPTLFLINRKNELSARGETIKDLEAAVKALL